MSGDADDRVGAAQLTLELPHDVALGAEDFFISGSNEHAYGLIEAWPDWPKRALVLSGPPGSGKTHLASIWQRRSGARLMASDDLTAAVVPQLAGHPAIAIEDAPGTALDETALFHLLNLAGERDLALLITTTAYPSAWTVALPDLASRLTLNSGRRTQSAGRAAFAGGVGQAVRGSPARGRRNRDRLYPAAHGTLDCRRPTAG